jgi:hypothetical protein
MHNTPVHINWKNGKILTQTRAAFKSMFNEHADERLRRIIREFLSQPKIFLYEPTQEVGSTSTYMVTVDLKEVKVVRDLTDRARMQLPLALLKINGVALMYCRLEPEDPKKDEGLGILFKVCPTTDAMQTNRNKFEAAMLRYNASYDDRKMQKKDEQEAPLALAS